MTQAGKSLIEGIAAWCHTRKQEEDEMSDSDIALEAVERLEHSEERAGDSAGRAPGFDRRSFLRRTALTGAAVGSVSALLEACGSSASSGGNSASVFGSHPEYKFVFVNHV